jgi:WD40 repeat protein
MYRRLSVMAIAAIFLLPACRLTSMEGLSPTATVIPSAIVTDAPAKETSVALPVTETPESQPAVTTDWLSQLEVIHAGNWARLQLLKTFPAEMPLNHSAVAISSDGKTMAVGSSSGAKILFFDLPSGQLSQAVSISGVPNADAYFNTMEYLPDGTIMANSDSPYAIYHMDTVGNVLSAWDGIGFALSADRKIMIHDADEGITLVEIANYTPIVSLQDESGFDFSLSPDGSKIAVEDVGVDYIHTTVWDIPSKSLLTTLEETAAPRFSPDGKFLAAIRYDYENDTTPLKIFSPDGAVEITTLNAGEPNDLINRAPVWAMDGSVLVAQITNGSPIAWETTNWGPLDAPALQGTVYSFSPDGRILVTRTSDGGILLWGVLP